MRCAISHEGVEVVAARWRATLRRPEFLDLVVQALLRSRRPRRAFIRRARRPIFWIRRARRPILWIRRDRRPRRLWIRRARRPGRLWIRRHDQDIVPVIWL